MIQTLIFSYKILNNFDVDTLSKVVYDFFALLFLLLIFALLLQPNLLRHIILQVYLRHSHRGFLQNTILTYSQNQFCLNLMNMHFHIF